MNQLTEDALPRETPISKANGPRSAAPLDDPRLIQALEEYRAALESGQRPDRDEFLSRHPEVRDALAGCLAALEFVHVAGPDLSRPEEHSDPATPAFPLPTTPLGDFRILREVGRGGMGVVYEAEQLSLGRRVALKVLPFAATLDSKQLQRFKNEAQAAAHLHHQNIVPVYAVGYERGVHYFAMQFIDGQTLAGMIAAQRQRGAGDLQPTGPYTPAPSQPAISEGESPSLARRANEEAAGFADTALEPITAQTTVPAKPKPGYFRTVAHLGIQAAEALEHAHQLGVVHRDIKPANLLVDSRGNLWIMDFGLAHIQSDVKLTMTGDLLGTIRYMSPEQALAKGGILDHRTDVYSLGATLYELLTLEAAYPGSDRQELLRQIAFEEPKPPRRLNKQIPAELETIVLKAMAKTVAERFATSQELADDLRRFLEDRPIHAKRPTGWQRLRKWAHRHQAVVRTAAVATLLLVVLGVLGLVASNLAITKEKNQALIDRNQATAAKIDARLQLFEAQLSQAQASRWSGRMGQRFKSLQALAEAAQIARELNLGEKRLLELRNEAIACLALADVRLLLEWEGAPEGTLNGVVFDANLEHYARSDVKGNISIRRAGDDEEVALLPGSGVGANVMTFSPNGDFLVVLYHELLPKQLTNFRVWNWRRQEISLQPSFPVIWSPAGFNPVTSQLAVGQAGGRITVYDPATGKEAKRLAVDSTLICLAFSSDGSQLAIGCQDGREVEVRDLATGDLKSKFATPAIARCLAWQQNGPLLAVACADNQIYVMAAATGRQHAVLQGHQAEVTSVFFAPAGDLLLSSAWDNTGRLWDPWTGRQLTSLPTSTGQLSRSGLRLATRSGSKLALWEVNPGREYRILPSPAALEVRGYADGTVSPDGRWLAVGGSDGVRLWDLALEKEQALLPTGWATGAAFHPSSKELYTSGSSGLVRWPFRIDNDVLRVGPAEKLLPGAGSFQRLGLDKQGHLLTVVEKSSAWVLNLDKPESKVQRLAHNLAVFVAVSPDGRWVATGTWNGFGVKVWDAADGQCVRELLPDVRIAAVAFSPDGRWLVTSAETVDFWDAGCWNFAHRIIRERGGASCHTLAFSPDGSMLAVAVARDVLELVESSTGRAIARLQGPNNDALEWSSFSPDGNQLIVVAGKPAQVRIWDVRLIRTQLRGLGLDWAPAPDATPPKAAVRPLRVEVDLGQLTSWEVNSLVIAFFPFHAEAYYRRGLAIVARTQWPQWPSAHDDFSMAILLKPDHADALLRRGRVHFQFQRWDKVVADFSQVLDKRPEDRETWVARGQAYGNLRQWEKAAADYSRAIELKPEDPLPWRYRANAYVQLAQWDKALADLTRLIELKYPTEVLAWSIRGEVHEQAQQWEKALADFSKVIELQPEQASHWWRRGAAYQNRKVFDKAIADFTKAVEVQPNYLPAIAWRSQAYEYMQQYDKALDDLSKAIELRPQDPACWSTRCRLNLILRRWDKALADHAKLIELKFPDEASAWHNRGYLYFQIKDWDKALADFSKAIELQPQKPLVYINRSNAYIGLKHWDKALADHGKLIELKYPDEASAWGNRGNVHQQAQQWDKALADFSKAIELEPQNPRLRNYRSNVYVALKQWDKALADHGKLIELKYPDEPSAWGNRGNVYQQAQQWDKAVADYSKAIELKPNQSYQWWRRGRAYHDQGKSDQAISDFSKAIELEPEDVMLWSERGLAFGQKKDVRKAIADFSKAIELDPTTPIYWVQRGNSHSGLKQWDRAVADFSKYLELAPRDAAYWGIRGHAYAELDQWDKAAADFAQCIKLGSPEQLSPRLALAQLGAKDLTGYRRTCAGMLERSSQAAKSVPAELVAWTCALSHEEPADPAEVVKLAEKASAANPRFYSFSRALGAALLRSGKFEAAAEQLKIAAASQGQDAPATWLFLAITYQRWGKKNDAKPWLDKAVQWIEKVKNEKVKDPDVGEITRWEQLPWNERLALQVLRREAEDLLKTTPAPAKQKEE